MDTRSFTRFGAAVVAAIMSLGFTAPASAAATVTIDPADTGTTADIHTPEADQHQTRHAGQQAPDARPFEDRARPADEVGPVELLAE